MSGTSLIWDFWVKSIILIIFFMFFVATSKISIGATVSPTCSQDPRTSMKDAKNVYTMKCESQHFRIYVFSHYQYQELSLSKGVSYINEWENLLTWAVNDPDGPQFKDPTTAYTDANEKYEIFTGILDYGGGHQTIEECSGQYDKFGLLYTNRNFCNSSLNDCMVNNEINPNCDLSHIQLGHATNFSEPISLEQDGSAVHEFMHAIQISSYNYEAWGPSVLEEAMANWFLWTYYRYISKKPNNLTFDLIGLIPYWAGEKNLSANYNDFFLFSFGYVCGGGIKAVSEFLESYIQTTPQGDLYNYLNTYLLNKDGCKRSVHQVIHDINVGLLMGEIPGSENVIPTFSKEIFSLSYYISHPIGNRASYGFNDDPINAVTTYSYLFKEPPKSFKAVIYAERNRRVVADLVVKDPYGFKRIPFLEKSGGTIEAIFNSIVIPNKMWISVTSDLGEGGVHLFVDERIPQLNPSIANIYLPENEQKGWQLLSVPVLPKFPIPNYHFSGFGEMFAQLKNISEDRHTVDYRVTPSNSKDPSNTFPILDGANSAYLLYFCSQEGIDTPDAFHSEGCDYLHSKGIEATPSDFSIQGRQISDEIFDIPLKNGFNLIGNPFLHDINVASALGILAPNSNSLIPLSEAISQGFVTIFPYSIDRSLYRNGVTYSLSENWKLRVGQAFWVKSLSRDLRLRVAKL